MDEGLRFGGLRIWVSSFGKCGFGKRCWRCSEAGVRVKNTTTDHKKRPTVEVEFLDAFFLAFHFPHLDVQLSKMQPCSSSSGIF